MNDIVINKVQYIQKFIERAREMYNLRPSDFDNDRIGQDAAIFNIVRACEQSIDLANHIIRTHKMGIPSSSEEIFELLHRKSVIDRELAKKLQNMIHFRNVVTHLYVEINPAIVKEVIVSGLDDLVQFGDKVMEYCERDLL